MLDFYPNDRFAVFIDSANFRRSKQSINMYVDDVRLLGRARRIGAPHPSPLGLHGI